MTLQSVTSGVGLLQLQHLKTCQSLVQRFQDLIADRQPFSVNGLTIKTQAGDQLSGEQIVLKIVGGESEDLFGDCVREFRHRQLATVYSQDLVVRDFDQSIVRSSPLVSHSSALYHTRSTSATPLPREVFA